jgi:hypothetical protein
VGVVGVVWHPASSTTAAAAASIGFMVFPSSSRPQSTQFRAGMEAPVR